MLAAKRLTFRLNMYVFIYRYVCIIIAILLCIFCKYTKDIYSSLLI